MFLRWRTNARSFQRTKKRAGRRLGRGLPRGSVEHNVAWLSDFFFFFHLNKVCWQCLFADGWFNPTPTMGMMKVALMKQMETWTNLHVVHSLLPDFSNNQQTLFKTQPKKASPHSVGSEEDINPFLICNTDESFKRGRSKPSCCEKMLFLLRKQDAELPNVCQWEEA